MEEKPWRTQVAVSPLRRALGGLLAWLRRWRAGPPRQLRLCENLALGEKRFLSVVEYGSRKFLVGGTGNSLAMLAVLSAPGENSGPDQAAKSDCPVPLRDFGARAVQKRKRAAEDEA